MTDFQRRICFTLAALAAYRLGNHIPLPGLDLDFLISRHADYGNEPVGGEIGDAIAIAIVIPDQPQVRTANPGS